jgi:hypothetical protein
MDYVPQGRPLEARQSPRVMGCPTGVCRGCASEVQALQYLVNVLYSKGSTLRP